MNLQQVLLINWTVLTSRSKTTLIRPFQSCVTRSNWTIDQFFVGACTIIYCDNKTILLPGARRTFINTSIDEKMEDRVRCPLEMVLQRL